MIGKTLKQELTPSQYEICGLLVLGWEFKEIAIFLNRKQGGVRMDFRRIYERSGTSDKLELATRYAWERLAR